MCFVLAPKTRSVGKVKGKAFKEGLPSGNLQLFYPKCDPDQKSRHRSLDSEVPERQQNCGLSGHTNGSLSSLRLKMREGHMS